VAASDRVVVRALAEAELPAIGARIAALERSITYPLGPDRFHIDHGVDYFAFFRRLGALTYVVAERDGQLLAALAAIERRLHCTGDDPVWYLGDLKRLAPGVDRLAPRLVGVLRGAGPRRGYGISMDPGSGRANPMVRLARHVHPEVGVATRLHLYSLDATAMARCLPILGAHRGAVSFRSLTGTKDIVLASTGAPMRLLHAQWGECAEAGDGGPEPDHVHMFCAPRDDGLDRDVRARGLVPTASATILHVGMAGVDWGFVLTSDI
jgi:hypothetical protein